MGDRTYVILTVPKEAKEKVETLASCIEHIAEDGNLVLFHFDEVNYGELPFLPQLVDAGIPFSSNWEDGDNYGAGGKHVRFTPVGEYVDWELYAENDTPDIDSLMTLIDDPIALRQYILDYKDRRTVLPWDNQMEYGKRFLARRLIDSELRTPNI